LKAPKSSHLLKNPLFSLFLNECKQINIFEVMYSTILITGDVVILAMFCLQPLVVYVVDAVDVVDVDVVDVVDVDVVDVVDMFDENSTGSMYASLSLELKQNPFQQA